MKLGRNGQSNTGTLGAPEASSLLHAVCNFEFVFCLVTVQRCLSFVKGLTRLLQERSLGVFRGLTHVQMVQTSLENCRKYVAEFNGECFRRAKEICEPFLQEQAKRWKKLQDLGRQMFSRGTLADVQEGQEFFSDIVLLVDESNGDCQLFLIRNIAHFICRNTKPSPSIVAVIHDFLLNMLSDDSNRLVLDGL